MSGRTVVHWNKEDCADMKIVKVDLLGLGIMAVMKDLRGACATVLRKAPRSGPTGVMMKFIKCSREQTQWACYRWKAERRCPPSPENRPDKFYDLVVQVASIRPGTILFLLDKGTLKNQDGVVSVKAPQSGILRLVPWMCARMTFTEEREYLDNNLVPEAYRPSSSR